ncbi:hypothetical protein PYCC9005_000071 [Savitreella phatthalungensis]
MRVLVVGAGVSGSICAYLLGKAGHDVLVIERSPKEQRLGQGIEIEEPALEVIRQMEGVLEDLQAIKTAEAGFELVNDRNGSYGKFDAGGFSPTGALEFMRGDLVDVLYKAAAQYARYSFSTKLISLANEADDTVTAEYARRDESPEKGTFDVVIGADGARSSTRRMIFPDTATKCMNPLGAVCAYFSIPLDSEFDTDYSRLCHFPGGRVAWLRPRGKGADIISVYLIHWAELSELRQAAAGTDRALQKRLLAKEWTDCGWQIPRVLRGLAESDNFYLDDLAQVKLQSWHKGRTVLVGDSAWAPTPVTGQGNQLAIIGAWILSQELNRSADPAAAFKQYDTRLRKYVSDCQAIPLGGYAPKIFAPQTSFGIAIFRAMYYVLNRVVKYLPQSKEEDRNPEIDLQTS